MPETWNGKSTFSYVGTVETGTIITYGQGRRIKVTAQKYAALRQNFLNRVIPVGTSRTMPPCESLGAWLKTNVTLTAIASYVAPILILEKFAERIGRNNICIIR